MTFSKSFGYAVSGILYVALHTSRERNIQLGEIARTLNAPRYFLAKVMEKIVKEGYLDSAKGHSGGFSINQKTLDTTLMSVAVLTGELNDMFSCILRFQSCNNKKPCPLHHTVEPLRTEWNNFLTTTQFKHLIDGRSKILLNNIS
ncbi:MAG: Rrf2 family transcriptional regulator [Gemmatimonadaceae bacterium]|nr:Rrf2 family transcriptional regulator [Chitinophagaceae bacterium]